MYSNLFSKGKIGKSVVRNRIVMLPMSTNLPNENGAVTKELIDYYAERAKGGAGLIIVESAAVDYPRGKNGATKLRCDQVNFVPGFSRLADAIHLYGAKVILQVQHAGSSTSREKALGSQPVAPSAITKNGEVIAAQLSIEEIKDIIASFVRTAKYCKEAGFDGVEVHAAHSYLLAQFLTETFNKRTDEYGGDLSKRSRILLEIVQGIRQEVGPDFVIAVRLNGDDFTSGGMTVDDAKEVAILLQKASVDILDISTGLTQHSENLSMYWQQGWRVYLAKAIKQVVDIPVIAGGNIRDPHFADEVVARGDADFVGLARGLLADPYWPNKAFRGEVDRIRPCISCNIGCTDRRIGGIGSIRCTVNPDVGQEGRQHNSVGCADKKKIVVIGAGAAGLNAALEAKRRGHEVIILEKGNDVGGVLNIASIPFGKQAIQRYVNYLRDCLTQADLRISFNEEATFEKINSYNPDAVVIATGSRSIIPSDIPGIADDIVVTSHDVLGQKVMLTGKNIAIIGGGSIGCEVADFLAENNKVTLIEMRGELAADIQKQNRVDLLKRLDAFGVNSMLDTQLKEIFSDKIRVSSNGQLKEISVDFVVLAVGVVPALPEWAGKVLESQIDSFVIGDALLPSKLIDAVSQGVAVGRLV